MANIFRMRRSAVSGRVPTPEQLKLGELAINTVDGKLFMKKDVGGVESIVDITAAGGGIPEAPIDGKQYGRQDGDWTEITGGGGGGSDNTVSDTPPSNPEVGDLWYDLTTARLYVYTGTEWVDSNPDNGMVASTVSGTAPESPNEGDFWYDLTVGRTFIWTGSEWADSNPDAGGGGSGGGIPEAPVDGGYYVRHNGTWINIETVLGDLGVPISHITDGGNFTTGGSQANSSQAYDGGNFTTGAGEATDDTTLDGGLFTG